MSRKFQTTTLLVAILTFCVSAFALPQDGVDRGGDDPAPRPRLLKPAGKAPPPAAMPDTSALLPGGMYEMRLSIGQKSMSGPVQIARQGGAVTVTMDVGETLTGTLDTSGKLQLGGGSGPDQLSMAGTVQNRRASGSAQLSQSGNKRGGSFTLDPSTGARKLQEWKTDQPSPATPKPPGDCGFWCKVKRWLGL